MHKAYTGYITKRDENGKQLLTGTLHCSAMRCRSMHYYNDLVYPATGPGTYGSKDEDDRWKRLDAAPIPTGWLVVQHDNNDPAFCGTKCVRNYMNELDRRAKRLAELDARYNVIEVRT